MRNLLAFLQRFRVFLVFALLQILALTTYFSVISYPRTKFLNSSSRVSASLLSMKHNVTKHFSLEEANDQLREHNAELMRLQPEFFLKIDERTLLVRDTLKTIAFEKISAKVIDGQYTSSNNYFTINAGRKRGIQPKMGVISDQGVVGVVYSVSEHYALVKSILTKDINISAYIKGIHAHGLIKYLDPDPRRVSLTGISNDIRLVKKASVLTRGSAGCFPAGLPIGFIESISLVEGKPLWNVKVRLAQDMRKLHNVYVIKHIHQEELDELKLKAS